MQRTSSFYCNDVQQGSEHMKEEREGEEKKKFPPTRQRDTAALNAMLEIS